MQCGASDGFRSQEVRYAGGSTGRRVQCSRRGALLLAPALHWLEVGTQRRQEFVDLVFAAGESEPHPVVGCICRSGSETFLSDQSVSIPSPLADELAWHRLLVSGGGHVLYECDVEL